MVRGTAVAAAELPFKSDFGRSDTDAGFSALCCDCGGRLDKRNVNKWLLQRERWSPKNQQTESVVKEHWDPPETPLSQTVAELSCLQFGIWRGEAGKFYRECQLNSELSSFFFRLKSLSQTIKSSSRKPSVFWTLWKMIMKTPHHSLVFIVVLFCFYFCVLLNSSVLMTAREVVISLSVHVI